MLAQEDLPGPLAALSGHAATALKEGYIKAHQEGVRQRQGVGPLCHHPTLQAPRA